MERLGAGRSVVRLAWPHHSRFAVIVGLGQEIVPVPLHLLVPRRACASFRLPDVAWPVVRRLAELGRLVQFLWLVTV